MTKLVRNALLGLLLLIMPAAVSAQRVASRPTAAIPAPTLVDTAPSRGDGSIHDTRAFRTAHEAALPAARLAPSRASKAYMLAGGALFVAGLIIGGDAGTAVAIAGGGIGAYGIYLHFR